LTNLYEGMFVVDNAVVRQGWKAAKAIVTEILDKHEANTITARRWDERRLSYSIKGRGRATYLLSYFELSGEAMPALNRSLELNESVLRYLITRASAVPATEAELASREEADDFVVPAPPVEDAPAPVVEAESDDDEDEKDDASDDDSSEDGDSDEGASSARASVKPEREKVAAAAGSAASSDDSESQSKSEEGA